MRRLLPVLLITALVGCATTDGAVDRDHVSNELEARTGGGIRSLDDDASLPPGVELGTTVSVDDAAAVALWRNPGFLEALGELELSRAGVLQAGLLRDPTLSFLFPFGPKQYEWTLGLPLQDLWQRPRRVAAARLAVEEVATLLVQNGLDLARDVRVAHAEWILAVERAERGAERIGIHERLVEQASARRELGEASPVEAQAARTALDRSRVDARRLDAEVLIARSRFWALLDLPDEPSARPEAAPLDVLRAEQSVEELCTQAFALRPELRAAELAIEAASEKLGLAKRQAWEITATLDANEDGSEGFEAGPGVSLTLPILAGARGRRVRAQAELEQAARHYVTVRQRISHEVREAALNLAEAERALREWGEDVRPGLEEGVRIANVALDAGDVAPSAALRAQLDLLDGRIRVVDLEADLRRARARYERALGGRADARDPELTREDS